MTNSVDSDHLAMTFNLTIQYVGGVERIITYRNCLCGYNGPGISTVKSYRHLYGDHNV